jgi:hypothetical protein
VRVKLGEVRREVRREHRLISRELTPEERRTLRNSWTVQPKPGGVAEPERPGYGKEEQGKEYGPPEKGSEILQREGNLLAVDKRGQICLKLDKT